MALRDRIKEARLGAGLTQEQLAQKVGVKKTTITGYEKGNREPTAAMVGEIANATGVGVKFLFQDEQKELELDDFTVPEIRLVKKYRALDEHGKKMVDYVITEETARIEQAKKELPFSAPGEIIPLPKSIQSASAGYGDLADDETAEIIYVYRNNITAKADYIMTVDGNSMEPKFFNGQQVLVRQQPSVDLGEIGIFIKDGLRFIKIYRGNHMESANPKYKDEPFEEYSKCIGKVLGLLENDWIVEE